MKYKLEVNHLANDQLPKLWTKEVEAEDMFSAGIILIEDCPLDMDDTILSIQIIKII